LQHDNAISRAFHLGTLVSSLDRFTSMAMF
jgi:hypothetical protein